MVIHGGKLGSGEGGRNPYTYKAISQNNNNNPKKAAAKRKAHFAKVSTERSVSWPGSKQPLFPCGLPSEIFRLVFEVPPIMPC